MDSDSLQFRAGQNILWVTGHAFQVNPPLELPVLPDGLYRYGVNNRLLITSSGTQTLTLTAGQVTTLNDNWPLLVALAVDAYAAEYIQSVTGDRDQQIEDILLWTVRLQTGDALEPEEEEFAEALQVWLGQVRETKADKHAELEEPNALATFDLYDGWPPFPPESY